MYEQAYNPFAKNLAVVKEYFKTPVTLALGLTQAVGTVLSVVTSIIVATQLPAIIRETVGLIVQIFRELGAPSSMINEITSAIDQVPFISSFSYSMIPSVVTSALISGLIVAGYLIIYFKSRNADPLSSPKAGVTILYVFAIIELVGAVLATIALVGIIILLFWLYFQLQNGAFGAFPIDLDIPYLEDILGGNPFVSVEFNAQILLIVIVVLSVVFAILIFLLLFVAINKKRYYGSIRASISTVELHSEGAKPYGVMCVISAIFTGISMLSAIGSIFTTVAVPGVRLGSLTLITVLSAFASVVSFVAIVLEAKLALGYKNHIDTIKYGYSQHAAPAAPYAPFPAGAGYVNPQNQPMNNPYVSHPQQPDTANSYSDPYGMDNGYPGNSYGSTDPGENPYAADTAAQPDDNAAPAAGATCPHCGAEIDPSAPFCGNCGKKL